MTEPTTPVPTRLPAWKKLLFTLLVTVGFFLLLEGVLATFGLRPVLYDEDPYVGFAGQIPLFTEELRDGKAHLITAENKLQFFNRQEFPRQKDNGVFRVFCVGGSTTYGRPYDDRTSFCGWLRAFVGEASSRQWEIINAGGISYASYRVALLMEELARYDPDLFIVYSGHNEFLENRTYAELAATPQTVQTIGAFLSRTRLYAALRSVVGKSDSAVPLDGDKLLPAEVKARLDTTVGPADYRRDDALAEQILAHYRYNLDRMVNIARSVGARVLFVAPASNLRDCSPFKSEFRTGTTPGQRDRLGKLLSESLRLEDENNFDAALGLLDTALTLDTRYAETHYRRGRLLAALRRSDDAKVAYLRARDEDVCPLRALGAIRDVLSQVAADRAVPWIDFDAFTAKRAAGGIPGRDLFLDHVHPTIDTHRNLALTILERLENEGMLKPSSSWNEQVVERVTTAVNASIDADTHGVALRNLAKVLGWAGKFEDVRRLASQATKLLPGDSEAHFLLGVSNERLGSLPAARAAYLRTLELEPNYADARTNLGRVYEKEGSPNLARQEYEKVVHLQPQDGAAQAALGNLLVNQGDVQRGVEHLESALQLDPENTEARQKLGVVFLNQGRLVEAERHLKEVVRQRPGFARAHNNLGVVLAETGRVAEAVACHREAVRLNPVYTKAIESLANLAMREKDVAAAIAHFGQVLAIEPEHSEVRAKLDFLGGRFEARLATTPNDVHAQYLSALVLAAIGRDRSTVLARLRSALELARQQGKAPLASAIAARLEQLQ
jgi:tetratricopeptide (TPR) repeat protein